MDLICLLISNSGFYIRILNSLTLNRSEARITLNSTCNKSFCEPLATERRSKKLTDITDAHGVFNTDFFDLSFPMQRDSKRICKCDRLRLVLDHEICRRPTDQREVISRIPRKYTMSQPTRFVRFVRLVFEKNILAYELNSDDHKSPESHEYIPGRNLNNSLDSCD